MPKNRSTGARRSAIAKQKRSAPRTRKVAAARKAATPRPDNAILTEAIAVTTVVADGKREPITKERFANAVLGINDRTLRKKLDGRRLTPLERKRCEEIVTQAKGSTDGHYVLRDDDQARA